VAYDRLPSRLGFADLQVCLNDRLGVAVDLVLVGSLKPRLDERVAREIIWL